MSNYFNLLPTDIILNHIFTDLDKESIYNCKIVDKRFHELGNQEVVDKSICSSPEELKVKQAYNEYLKLHQEWNNTKAYLDKFRQVGCFAREKLAERSGNWLGYFVCKLQRLPTWLAGIKYLLSAIFKIVEMEIKTQESIEQYWEGLVKKVVLINEHCSNLANDKKAAYAKFTTEKQKYDKLCEKLKLTKGV